MKVFLQTPLSDWKKNSSAQLNEITKRFNFGAEQKEGMVYAHLSQFSNAQPYEGWVY